MEENNPLDVSSSSFDPLAALYSEDVVIPDTSAPIEDNVEKFIARLNKPTTSGKKSEKNKPIPVAVQRQFTEEQMPIKCPRRQGNNVLTYMERQKKGKSSHFTGLKFFRMFKSEAALKAAQTLSDQITAVKTQLRTLQDKCGGDQLVIEGDCQNVGDLEKEVIELASETEVLKKSAPEGNDESNIQYFLAIAELEKTNKILRQQEIITNDNLKSLDLDIEGTRNDLEELKKLKEMKPASVTEKNKENVGSSDKLSEVENKVRGTRKLFKEFKSFLTDYLKQIDPVVSGENGGHLGHLLQVMWTSFQGCINDNIPATSEESYIKMSFLDFDVEEDHINLLVKNGIAELHPEQKDLIRLVNFVE